MMLLCNRNKKKFSKLYVECALPTCQRRTATVTMMWNYSRCHVYLFIGAYYPTLSEVPSIRCVDRAVTGGVKIKLVIFYGIV